VPILLLTLNVVTYSPGLSMVPVICPVFPSHINPDGRFPTSNFMGLFPVAGIVNRKGEPGLTPNTIAPFIRGDGPGFGVRITLGSTTFVPGPLEQEPEIIMKAVNSQIGFNDDFFITVAF
jgi:hypothetical protein